MSDRFMTEGEALDHHCPQRVAVFCLGAGCMAWRWEGLACSPEWVEAVKAQAIKTGEADKCGPKSKAARYVAENPAEFGLPEKPFRGFCGLAGRPAA